MPCNIPCNIVRDKQSYLTIVSALIRNTELLFARLYLVDKECRAILDGVRDEADGHTAPAVP
jgi:hypothetical protein